MTAPTPAEAVPFTQRRDFWVVIGLAALLGVLGGLFGLLFMWVIDVGNNWYSYSDTGWMGGHWWWVAVTVVAGILVGLLRMLSHLPDKTPGIIAELQDESVDTHEVAGTVLVSAASLIGGASLGPEKALGSFGGGAGQWLARRGSLNQEDVDVATLSGFAGAYGGVFSSTIVVVLMILEVARPGGAKFTKVLISSIVSSSISFGIYFAVAGALFLGAYDVPAYDFKTWQLLAGVGLGLVAAVVVTVLGLIIAGAARLFDQIKAPSLVKSTIGGAIFGVIGVVLPLTMFTGTSQLAVVLKDGSTLGLGLVLVLVLAKAVTFGVSLGSGFVGGPIFPSLFVGGTAGVAVHLAIPDLPLGLTFTCLLAAVVGGMVSAPFAMVLFAAFTTQVGALNTAPVLIAVVTSYLTVEAVKYVVVGRKREAAATTAAEPPPT
ncbi:MAG: chloride channel protein [Acidimicrobiales bacterium]